ncbi:hypothetical protein J1N35_002580 [Gossypium stocksii]|uniref:Vacuolar protein 8 n=1 Tax=Gossypium stocksii TaxID=47602 RepID=A0A9D3WJR3_9ROSI|nr:hypothetical protein J1N35_002580 [Gossypium stocksii]
MFHDKNSRIRRCLARGGSGNAYPGLDSPMSQVRDSLSGHKTPVSALFDQVGVQKILDLLESEDANVRIHAVKVVANLAAEEVNQERIVEAGGLTSLLMLCLGIYFTTWKMKSTRLQPLSFNSSSTSSSSSSSSSSTAQGCLGLKMIVSNC